MLECVFIFAAGIRGGHDVGMSHPQGREKQRCALEHFQGSGRFSCLFHGSSLDGNVTPTYRGSGVGLPCFLMLTVASVPIQQCGTLSFSQYRLGVFDALVENHF